MQVGRIRARRDRELEVLRQIAHVVGRAAGGGGARGGVVGVGTRKMSGKRVTFQVGDAFV